MLKLKQHYAVITAVVLIVNAGTYVFTYGRIESMILHLLVSSSVLLIVMLAAFFHIHKKLTDTISSIQELLQQYVRGNFLAEMRGGIVVEDFQEIDDNIKKLKGNMQNWLYNIMHAKVHMKDFAKKLQDNTNNTLQNIHKISNGVLEINENSFTITNDSEENAAIAEQLLGSNSEVASSTYEFRDFTMSSVEKIENNSKEIDDTLEGIYEIQKLTSDNSKDIQELGGLVESITLMSNVITEIADKTNLLSLNASIEAAKAGSAGRGFAVVAEEIKKLANQSADTSKEINNSIVSIQAKIKKVMEGSRLCTTRTTDIREKSNRASNDLKEINEKIKAMMDFINHISNSIKEQNMAVETLAQNVERSAGFTNELNGTIEDMKGEISQQVKNEENNLTVSNSIIDISNNFNEFTKNFEEQLDKELISLCEKVATLVKDGIVNNDFLEKMSRETGISEFYITDASATTVYCNNPNGIGFTFTNDEATQAYEFYKILQNPKLKVCQPMQIRDIDGKYFKFAAVSRLDGKGIVQVGLHIQDILSFRGQYAMAKILGLSEKL
ncbi:MAG: hypothetical protein JJT76_08800 [Clostridiaceae bacterium]|nr:hypothetical protein [Clostridiaceae bacterium]